MEQIINQLVEIDSAGQSMVRQAQESKQAEQAQMAEYKRRMREEHLKKQQARVDQVQQTEAQALEESLHTLEKTHAVRMAQLRAQYEQHAQEWIAGMVRRCTGG